MNERIIKLYHKVRDFFTDAADKRIDIYSACAAFYIFMSFIPFTLIMLSLIKYLPFSKQDLLDFIDTVLPIDLNEIIVFIIDELYNRGIGILSISVIATVWASAKGVFGITKGLNEIHGLSGEKSNVYLRVRSAICTVSLMMAMVLMLIISVFGNGIISIVTRHVVIPDEIVSIIAVRNIIMFCVLFLLFLFLFCVLPAKKIRLRTQIIGAALSSAIWIGFTKIFSFYLSTFNGYSMYGGFAVILVIGIWLYGGMYIMFMGAMVNEAISSRKGLKNETTDQ